MAFVRRRRRVRKCKMCSMKIDYIDYKDTNFLSDFVNERGKIVPKRINGNCAKHQRMVRQAIQRARHMALIPFTRDV
ncbi:30S ribosomal protein S18 [Tepiditoga spiralis]|uniref:Small ribosomal subunit protein bS18 n=1 Tax=Tepiditoga spiralis TaxID=2108365 RepID=A0A7G1G6Z8_9BACT|nr:30S ribosomal protein S18 [Tepiditoga spiralis]BBE31136.1 30S ribosomal protein S18 [Tepiditoga spiralis]